jgi:hypothetical protein
MRVRFFRLQPRKVGGAFAKSIEGEGDVLGVTPVRVSRLNIEGRGVGCHTARIPKKQMGRG